HKQTFNFSFLSFLFSIFFVNLGQFFLLLLLKKKEANRQFEKFVQQHSKVYELSSLLFIIIVSFSIYAGLELLDLKSLTRKFFVFCFLSPIIFLSFYAFHRIYLYLLHASKAEKQDFKNQPNTLLCGLHYVRGIPKRKALVYVSYECPIADCGREHLIAGVEQFVGILDAKNSLETMIEKDTMYIPLWNAELRQAIYAEVDSLQISYVPNFGEEDYAQMIQAVVGKFYNHMQKERLKQLTIEIAQDVYLSEITKRLLQDTFAEVKWN
ncbi:MAG: hypothetical protein AAF518_11240, partial [Spirochaetota bacterium]